MRKPGPESEFLFPEMEDGEGFSPIPPKVRKLESKSDAPRIDEQIHCQYCEDAGSAHFVNAAKKN